MKEMKNIKRLNRQYSSDRLLIYSSKKGSILVEALLSVVILSISITLIIQAMTASLRATTYGADYSQALFLMENKMSEMMRSGTIASYSGQKEFLDKPFDRYMYEVRHLPLYDEEESEIHHVDAEISWESGKKSNQIIVQTYMWSSE